MLPLYFTMCHNWSWKRAKTNGEGGDSDDLVTLPEFYLNLSRTSWYKLCTSHLLEEPPTPGRLASAISDTVVYQG
jgi:hypothetical protein